MCVCSFGRPGGRRDVKPGALGQERTRGPLRFLIALAGGNYVHFAKVRRAPTYCSVLPLLQGQELKPKCFTDRGHDSRVAKGGSG